MEYRKPRVWDAVVILAIIVLVAFYGVVAISTNDPLWMWPRFDGQPVEIVIYDQGTQKEITPSSPDYAAINSLLNAALSKVTTFHGSLGVSDESINDYRTQYQAIEVFYGSRIVIHTRFNIGQPNNLLIPLTGRHSDYNAVFCGYNGAYWPGALGLKSLDAVKAALTARGYLH